MPRVVCFNHPNEEDAECMVCQMIARHKFLVMTGGADVDVTSPDVLVLVK